MPAGEYRARRQEDKKHAEHEAARLRAQADKSTVDDGTIRSSPFKKGRRLCPHCKEWIVEVDERGMLLRARTGLLRREQTTIAELDGLEYVPRAGPVPGVQAGRRAVLFDGPPTDQGAQGVGLPKCQPCSSTPLLLRSPLPT